MIIASHNSRRSVAGPIGSQRALQRLQRSASLFSLPTQASADRMESKPPMKVYVLDHFWKAEENTTHGELVEAELLRHQVGSGDQATVSVERKHVDLWTGPSGIEENRPGALTAHIKRHFATRLERDADAFAEILDDTHAGRAVIHQSQGSSQSRVVQGLYGRAGRDENFRKALQAQLGVEASPGFGDKERAQLLNGLLSESHRVHQKNPEVRAAIEELRLLQEEAHQRGHVHVISAGNQGRLAQELERLEVEAPDGFFTNEMAGPRSIIVGATDDQSQAADSHHPHRVADLASPDAGAHFGADGVDRPLDVDGQTQVHSGSSYAAPQISSLVVDLLREDETLSYDAIINTLNRTARPLAGAESFVGRGYLRR